MKINYRISTEDLKTRLIKFWILSANKSMSINRVFDFAKGSPVYTVEGKYVTRGWTEWTLGFHFGSVIFNYEMTGDIDFLKIAREGAVKHLPVQISNTGVHDHGFNIVSTYGNLLRLMREGKIQENEWEEEYYKLALKISGAVQASRWTELNNGGYIYSFNGPHSLFIDTIRTIRILMLSGLMGHTLLSENESKINLLQRAADHLRTTAAYSVFYGKGRDIYDVTGRVAHECIFHTKNGTFRGPDSQQGYSGRTTWMRGLAWAMLGFAEELELLDYLTETKNKGTMIFENLHEILAVAATVTCEYYLEHATSDGIPYWDSGAPGLAALGNYSEQPSDPYNTYEPVDSSAAVIAAQGLLRMSFYEKKHGNLEKHRKYYQAGLTIADTLLSENYLSEDVHHQGLILHSVYHRPNGWDYKQENDKVPYGESSMWGDYHARELALYLDKIIKNDTYYTFFDFLR